MTSLATRARPTSSSSSRSTASIADSPGSSRPPGSAHWPAWARSLDTRRVSTNAGAPSSASVIAIATAAWRGWSSPGQPTCERTKPAHKRAISARVVSFSGIGPTVSSWRARPARRSVSPQEVARHPAVLAGLRLDPDPTLALLESTQDVAALDRIDHLGVGDGAAATVHRAFGLHDHVRLVGRHRAIDPAFV